MNQGNQNKEKKQIVEKRGLVGNIRRLNFGHMRHMRNEISRIKHINIFVNGFFRRYKN